MILPPPDRTPETARRRQNRPSTDAAGDIFRLQGPVGIEAANDRDDVIRAQILLGHAGDYDLGRLGGPTGWAGGELVRALRGYQRRKGLTADGVMLPDGETMAALEEEFGDRLAGRIPPTTQDVDTHHDLMAAHRAAGDDEAPAPRTAIVMPGENEAAWMQRRQTRPGAVVRDIDADDIDAGDGPRFTPGAQVAHSEPQKGRYRIPGPPGSPPPEVREQAAREARRGINRAIDAVKQVPETLRERGETAINLLRLQNEALRQVMGMADPLPPLPPSIPLSDADKALGKTPPLVPLSEKDKDLAKTPPLVPTAPEMPKEEPETPELSDLLILQGRAALEEGIRRIFESPLERHESANSKLSTRIIIKECIKLIKRNPRLKGFEHIAGGSDKHGNEISERAVKSGQLVGKDNPAHGPGHNFPDALFQRGKEELVGINSATESSPDVFIRREVASWEKLMVNLGKRVAAITGKKRPDESLKDYRLRARQVCERGFSGYLKPSTEKEQVPATASGKAR